MKLTNLRKCVASALAAAGIFIGGAAYGNNLVQNGDFENVDPTVSMGGYNAVLLLDWNAPTGDGYAYSHDPGSTGVPDYANGGPLADGGTYYFTSNANDTDNDETNPIFQDIDVSGLAGNLYTLSAYFSSYSTQGDFGTVKVEFMDVSETILGTGTIFDLDPSTWTQSLTSGLIPTDTVTARVSAFGTPIAGGPDGYIDNISFTAVPEPATTGLAGFSLLGILGWFRRKS